MTDQEKAVNAVEYLNWYFTQDDGAADKNAVKAWEVLLREQKPVKPLWALGRTRTASCGACKSWLSDHSWEYCPRCGRKVKWNG